jgi:hypothetical protein
MRRTQRLYAAAGAVLLIAFVALALPWLTQERARVTATPVPPSLYREVQVRLAPGQRACVDPVVIDRRTRQASFLVRSTGGDGPALNVYAGGHGYNYSTLVKAGYGDGPLAAPLGGPAHDAITVLCIANRGDRPVALAATPEPRRASTVVNGAPAKADLDGTPVPANVVLTLHEGRPLSIARYAGQILDHMTAFRPGFLTPAVAGVLLALTILLVAAGAPWAYARALAGDEQTCPTES